MQRRSSSVPIMVLSIATLLLCGRAPGTIQRDINSISHAPNNTLPDNQTSSTDKLKLRAQPAHLRSAFINNVYREIRTKPKFVYSINIRPDAYRNIRTYRRSEEHTSELQSL